jgi:xylan 1,4-beta-xylosidase
MRSFTAALFICVLGLFFAAPPSTAQNLILNPGFEEGAGDVPDGWERYPRDPGPEILVGWDASTAHAGVRSVMVSMSPPAAEVGFWEQAIPLTAGKVYTVSAFIKTRDIECSADVVLDFMDGNGILLYQTHVESIAGTMDWESRTWRLRCPPGSAFCRIFLILKGPGTVWFDDIHFAEDTETGDMEIEVDKDRRLGEIRNLGGVNKGPVNTEGVGDLTPGFLDLKIPLCRTHGWHGAGNILEIFPDMSADPDDPRSYDFPATDALILAAHDAGCEIIFRLGESLESDAVYSTPPADRFKWADVCRHVVMHYNEGWASGYHLKIRKWEIWNEPDIDLFWSGTPEQYYDLYCTTAAALKTHDPGLEVGGPAVCDFSNAPWVKGFLQKVKDEGAPLDLFTWHLYANSNPYEYHELAARVRETLDAYGFHATRSIIDEWNLYSEPPGFPTPDADGPFNSAFSVSVLSYLQDAPVDDCARYRADGNFFGLLRYDGTLTMAGWGHKAFSLLLDTPVRLSVTGGDTLGYAVLAGSTPSGDALKVLLGDPGSAREGYRLRIVSAPLRPFTLSRYAVEDTGGLRQVESSSYPAQSTVELRRDLSSPSAQVVEVRFDVSSNTPPSAPADLTITQTTPCTPGVLSVTWSPSSDPQRDEPIVYNLYRSALYPFEPQTENRVYRGEETTFTDHGLLAGIPYHYIVRAEDSLGLEGPNRPAESGVSECGPTAPLLLRHVAQQRSDYEPTRIFTGLASPSLYPEQDFFRRGTTNPVTIPLDVVNPAFLILYEIHPLAADTLKLAKTNGRRDISVAW